MPNIQLRHDTATNWTTYNPILLEGEVGVETDTNKMKIGDGTTAYNSLDYFGGDIDLTNYYNKTETDGLLDNKEDKFNTINPLSLGPTTIAIGNCYSREYRNGAFTNYTETDNIDNSIPTQIRLFSPNTDDGLQGWNGVGTLYVDLNFKYMKNSTGNNWVVEICKVINNNGRTTSASITGNFFYLENGSYSQGIPLTVGETYKIRIGLNYYSNTASLYLFANETYNLVQTATLGSTTRDGINLQNTDNPYKYSIITNFSISDIKVHTDGGSVLFSREVVNALSLKVGTGFSVDSNGNLVNDNPTAPSVMVGATSSTAGTAGLVPAPAAGDDTKFLAGDGTYKTVSGPDMSNYYNKSETDSLLDEKQDTLTANKPLGISQVTRSNMIGMVYTQDNTSIYSQNGVGYSVDMGIITPYVNANVNSGAWNNPNEGYNANSWKAYIDIPYTIGQTVMSPNRVGTMFGKLTSEGLFIPIAPFAVNSNSMDICTSDAPAFDSTYYRLISTTYNCGLQYEKNEFLPAVLAGRSDACITQLKETSTGIKFTCRVGNNDNSRDILNVSNISDAQAVSRLKEINVVRIVPFAYYGYNNSKAYSVNRFGLYNIEGDLGTLLEDVTNITSQENLFDISDEQVYNYLDLHIGTGLAIENGSLVARKTSDFSLFDFKWSDHQLNDIQWLRADTFSWQSGDVYTSAYNHLVADLQGITAETETIGSYTVTFYRATDGHKICLADQEQTVLNIYNESGVAWYYILDTTNTQFKLPRTKYGFEGLRGNVGDKIDESLPNIKAVASSAYQDNAPVQERATQMYLYFYVGEYSQTAIEQTAGLNAELFNGKADRDYSNCTYTPMRNDVVHIVETYVNSGSWYRVYSDGWCEQGGLFPVTNSWNTNTITFLKAFRNNNYNILYSNGFSNQSSIYGIASKSPTRAVITIYNGNTAGQGGWQACGYIN